MKMLNQIEFFIRFRCRGEFSSVTIAATDVFCRFQREDFGFGAGECIDFGAPKDV